MQILLSAIVTVSFLCTLVNLAAADLDPLVTLKHGGLLQGTSYIAGKQKVDHFVGVRYAKPPVGDLRFKKPEPADPWTGVELAQKGKGVCLHYGAANIGTEQKPIGEEDCLFLDVVVPGGVSSEGKKPVMVWIHGGGYILGHRMQYIPAVLAAHGDVIVVTINYRLGIFGFLSDRLGSGNYALWDQRAAIMWVKDNIGSFGGDAGMITIFGESAGGGSVVAQMMGKHNDGLFQRAIAESGSLYQPWGWYLSPKHRDAMIGRLKDTLKCEEDSVYDCFKGMSGVEVLQSAPPLAFAFFYHPVADGDFFPESTDEESYEPATRYDLMTGFNSMEGNLITGMMLGGYLAQKNMSLEDGCSAEEMQIFLHFFCSMMISSESPELCAYFINKEYGIDEATDDFDRVMRFTHYAGELNFNEDQVRLLSSHSRGDKSTYGYQFLPYATQSIEDRLWYIPEKLKNSADHGDEVSYIFGAAKVTKEMSEVYGEYKDDMFLRVNKNKGENFSDADKKMSDQVMTLWTNFAKSGNPNKPVKVESFPDWPEFRSDENKMMLLDYDSQPIEVPYKERMERLRAVLLQSRNRQAKEFGPATQTAGHGTAARDEL